MEEYEIRLHWIIFVGYLIALPLVYANIIWINYDILKTDTAITITECLLVTLIIMAKPFLDYFTILMKVDKGGVHIRKGLINVKHEDYSLDGIESVNLYQSLLGLIFNFGNVIVRGKGMNKESFRNIAEPQIFKDVLLKLKQNP